MTIESNPANEALIDKLAEHLAHNQFMEINPESINQGQEANKKKMRENIGDVSLFSAWFGALVALAMSLGGHIVTLNLLAVVVTCVVTFIIFVVVRILNHHNIIIDSGMADDFVKEFHVDQTANIVASYDSAIGGIHQYAYLLKEAALKLDARTAEDWADIIKRSKAGAPINDIKSYYEMVINLKRIASSRHSSDLHDEIMEFWNQFQPVDTAL